MKRLSIKIKDLIKRGVLRIFPLPNVVIVFVFVIVGLILIGCSAPRQVTQLVEHVQKDTVYLSNIQYDSIYIYQERDRDYHRGLGTLELGTLEPDTVFIKDVSIEYRYKLLRDTVRIVQRDSIPYEVTKIVTKEIQRPLTIFDRLCRICFYFLSGILFVLFVKLVFKLKSKLRI